MQLSVSMELMFLVLLSYDINSKWSSFGFLKAWYEFEKEVVVAHLRHDIISKGTGCGRIKYDIVS